MNWRTLVLTSVAVVVAMFWLFTFDAPPRSAPADWPALEAAELTGARAAQVARAQAARQALFGELFATLQTAMAERGPARAIPICRDEAPRIAERVSTEHGLRIGRTSARLRNPANRPPHWAERTVASQSEEPAYFAGPEGALGVLLPIRAQAPCLACHGTIEHLAPGVADALADSYLEDRATGFAQDDLRGWFWIEVPG